MESISVVFAGPRHRIVAVVRCGLGDIDRGRTAMMTYEACRSVASRRTGTGCDDALDYLNFDRCR
uniref:Uncharacterized protein n=1 Tax=Oryza nivara TaxID=4536 RepID=A0A0E0FMF6_ORYNI